MEYNVFGEAHYPKHSVDLELETNVEPKDIGEIVIHWLEQHKEATSLSIHLPRLK